MTLEFVASLDNPFGSRDESDAPSCHGVCLAHTIDDDDTVLDVGELSHGGVLAHIVDVLIDFIGDDDDTLVLEKHVLQCLQFLLAIDRAGGVAG